MASGVNYASAAVVGVFSNNRQNQSLILAAGENSLQRQV